MMDESEMVGVQFEKAPGSWAAHCSRPDLCYYLTFIQHLVFAKGSVLTFISHFSYQS